MKRCPYCGYTNYDDASACRKCQASLVPAGGTIYKPYWCGPQKARLLRERGLSAVVVGLLVRVYWGGYGPWPVIDYPPFASVRVWLEPLLLVGGAVLYIAGWFLNYI
jgi:hypothetical protein